MTLLAVLETRGAGLAVGATLALALAWPRPASADMPSPGKLEVVSEDETTSISFHFYAQMLLQHLHTGPWTAEENDGDTRVRYRRVRPVIRGKLVSERLSYLLHLSTAPGSLELMDLLFDYRVDPQLILRVGQQKIPFTRHRLNSFRDRVLVDWSWPTRYFGAERQYGVMAHNGMGKPPRWEYQAGVFSGVNARASNGVGMALAYADPIVNPSALVDAAPPADLHPEIAVHGAYNSEGINVRRPGDLAGGGLRYSAGVSAAWDLRPTERQDTTLRLASELLLKSHGWGLSAVAMAGLCERVTSENQLELCMAGSLASVSKVFWERYEVGARYGGVYLLAPLREDARQYADDLIANAAGAEEAAALSLRYAEVGRLRGEHEVGAAFAYYFLGTALKWQTDAAVLIHDRTGDDRYDLRARTQLQLAF